MSEKNKILFAGDPHGCFANVISAVFKYKPKAIVLLGDYNFRAPDLGYYINILYFRSNLFKINGQSMGIRIKAINYSQIHQIL